MMQEHDLRELAEFVSDEAPVLSLYLARGRQGWVPEEYKLSLRKLLEGASAAGARNDDVTRVEHFFEQEFDRQGRGLACFSCDGGKFWRSYTLFVSLPNAVYVGRRPYVKPLGDVWDNYERLSVIMVDREGARTMTYHLGELYDAAGTLGAQVRRHKQGGWAAQKLQRSEDQEARHNLKEAAEWANSYLAANRVTKVVLSGTDETLAEFRLQAPRGLMEKVVGQLNLDINATPVEVWERAYEVAQQAQRASEAEILEQIVTAAHKGGPGAIGLADTLAALQQGRVHQLLVDPGLQASGQQCTHCRAVVLEQHEACPYCGGALIRTADVVNLAVHQALDLGLKVSSLGPDSRLTEVGGIAAVLRY